MGGASFCTRVNATAISYGGGLVDDNCSDGFVDGYGGAVGKTFDDTGCGALGGMYDDTECGDMCTCDGSLRGGNDDRSVDDTNWYGDAFVDRCAVLRIGSGSSSFLNLPIFHKASNSTMNMMIKKKDSAYRKVS